METTRLRAWRAHRQGLDGSLQGRSASEILVKTGWARSVGGAAPYLTLFARGGLRRAEVDADVDAVRIHELPSARGCTYVLPGQDYALGLTVGQSFADGEARVALRLGVTEKEIGDLKRTVVNSLTEGPLDTEDIRSRVGPAARSLGPEGVKKGLSTTLPVALSLLQSEGEIRRVPIDGRIDGQRYRYGLWRPNPLSGLKPVQDGPFAELARKFFFWTGGATLGEFQWFSGLGAKAAKAAIEPLKLTPFAGELLMLPEDREALERFREPAEPQYVLVSSLDGIVHLRRELISLVDTKDTGHPLLQPPKPGKLMDLPDHAILDRGRLTGLWAYDPDAGAIAWMSFVKPGRAMKEAVARMEQFIREDLGDARSFSLDSPKSRVPRIAALRKAATA
ncbi:MAG: winged helix DNA-binding domain-containing protein [Acidobacteriota bacterium]|nr:winged helix DNA-binding domain-containing protein [Acidobacteriota bacterium]